MGQACVICMLQRLFESGFGLERQGAGIAPPQECRAACNLSSGSAPPVPVMHGELCPPCSHRGKDKERCYDSSLFFQLTPVGCSSGRVSRDVQVLGLEPQAELLAPSHVGAAGHHASQAVAALRASSDPETELDTSRQLCSVRMSRKGNSPLGLLGSSIPSARVLLVASKCLDGSASITQRRPAAIPAWLSCVPIQGM